MNYQHYFNKRGEEVFGYVQVGRWKYGNFITLQEELIQWHSDSENGTASGPVQSFCSEPCGAWEAKVGTFLAKSPYSFKTLLNA